MNKPERSRFWFTCSLRAWRGLFARYREPVAYRLRMRCLIAGSLASALEAMQERLFGAQLDSIDLPAPVFIVGHWRSGTTLLHELMALDESLLSPTTRQCFNPQSFLLSGESRRGAAIPRPSGDRVVSAQSPQEEEFALLCLGCRSPYEAFIFPRALDRLGALCDPRQLTAQERAQWDQHLVRFLKAVTLAGGPRRLLLKSPANSFRISELRRIFPGAVFVNLTREPRAVRASAIDMWQKMWQRYAIGSPPDQAHLERRVIEILRGLNDSAEAQLRCCPAGTAVTVKYEDLVAEPYGVLRQICAELKLGAGPSEDRVRELLSTSPPLRPSPGASAAIAPPGAQRLHRTL